MGGWAIGEDMAQVRTALAAQGFHPHHAVPAVGTLGNGLGQGLGKAGPAATGIEFCHEVNKAAPQQMQWYWPACQCWLKRPVNGRSVAAWRVTA